MQDELRPARGLLGETPVRDNEKEWEKGAKPSVRGAGLTPVTDRRQGKGLDCSAVLGQFLLDQ